MTFTLCPSCSLGLLNRRPRAHSSGPKDPIGLMWLSLPQFVYNSVRSSTQLPPLGVELNWNQNSIQLARRTQLNYIIVRRPLDLWNRMFNHHQATITVMQFRGHSLQVHHSVVYHGNFSCSSHFISQFPPTRFPLITVSLPSGASPWMALLAGSKGQNTTIVICNEPNKHLMT